jgi:hypothetical protein
MISLDKGWMRGHSLFLEPPRDFKPRGCKHDDIQRFRKWYNVLCEYEEFHLVKRLGAGIYGPSSFRF